MTVAPAPLQILPSKELLGNDGTWYTFELNVGTPSQPIFVLPSTLTSESLVVTPAGCTSTNDANCPAERGETFYNSSSQSWEGLAYNQVLDVDTDLNIGSDDEADFGYDTLGLTTVEGGGVVLDHQIVGMYSSPDFFVGLLGLSTNPSAVPGANQTPFLKTLFDQNRIPSLSYSYTAGAYYRESLPDLTFGGQDQARFVPNAVNLTMAPQVPELEVIMRSISLQTPGGSPFAILSEPTTFYVDSTVGELFLPQDTCQAFVDAFGLTVDQITDRFTLNSSARAKNLRNNASVVFELGNSGSGGQTVTITLPYIAFDANYTNEASTKPTQVPFFPIVPLSDGPYTLGRTFLQEAYLSVNNEYGNFSLYQAVPSGEKDSHVVPLPSLGSSDTTATPSPSSTAITVVSQGSSFPNGAIAGIVVAVVVLIGVAVGFFCLRRRRRRAAELPDHGVPVMAPHPDAANEKTPAAPEPVDGYFALPTKNVGAYATTRNAALSSNGDTPGELESPYGGPSSPQMKQTGFALPPNEIDSHYTPVAELPSRKDSVKQANRLSDAGSSSHTQQAQQQPTSASPEPPSAVSRTSWSETHFEDGTPVSARPSLMSAASVRVSASGAASLVQHTRNGSSRMGSIGGSPGLQTPAAMHSPGPSIDGSLSGANVQGSPDSTPAQQHSTPDSRAEQSTIRRANSQDTLVDPSGRASPVMERNPPPPAESPIDSVDYPTPAGAGLGYWGRTR